MNCLCTRFGLLGSTLLLTSCGSASVMYSPAQFSSDANVATIEQAAANGGLHVTLPITRLVVQVPKPANGVALAPAPAPVAPPLPAAAEGHAPVAPAVGAGSVAPGTQPATSQQTAVAALSTQLTGKDGTFTITALQSEGDVEFDVKGINNFFSENDFGITYLANTQIPATVSNTFTDQTAARVKEIASIAGALLPLLGAEAEGEAKPATPACDGSPVTLDLIANKHVWSSVAPAGTLPCFSVTITRGDADNKDASGNFVPAQKDLVAITPLLTQINANSSPIPRLWPVPACLRAHVTITPLHGGSPVAGDLTVIDPDYVSLMAVTNKGKIAMHPVCGADRTDTADDRWGAVLDTMSAIAATIPKSSKK